VKGEILRQFMKKKVGTGRGFNWLTGKYLCVARLASALFVNNP